MIEYLIFGFIGLLLGIVAGLLPGLGTGTIMVMLFLVLINLDPVSVILFFLGVLTSAQYVGSVTAILTGVPGDASSIPSSTWGFNQFKKGHGNYLISQTATWSLLAGTLGFVIVLITVGYGLYWAKSLSTVSQLIFLVVALTCTVIFSQNSQKLNFIMCLIGLGLASVGYSENFQTYVLSTPENLLSQGIPWLPVMAGLMTIPAIAVIQNLQVDNFKKSHTPTPVKPVWPAGIRGAVVGFIAGTIPGLSYILGSLISSKLEEKISGDPNSIVVASESANNAGATSMLLPLFILGIPITLSESIVVTAITTSNSIASIPAIFVNNWVLFSVYFAIINLILYTLSSRYARNICDFALRHINILSSAALIAVVCSVALTGWYQLNLTISLIALAVALLIGLKYRTFDWSPLIFAMLMQPFLESSIYKVYQLYL